MVGGSMYVGQVRKQLRNSTIMSTPDTGKNVGEDLHQHRQVLDTRDAHNGAGNSIPWTVGIDFSQRVCKQQQFVP